MTKEQAETLLDHMLAAARNTMAEAGAYEAFEPMLETGAVAGCVATGFVDMIQAVNAKDSEEAEQAIFSIICMVYALERAYNGGWAQ